MRRMDSKRMRNGRALLLMGLTTAVTLAASSAGAVSATFSESLGFGFDSLGLPPPTVTIPDMSVPFLDAGEIPGVDVELSGTNAPCILPQGSSICQPSVAGLTGPYSVIQQFQVSAINTPAITGPFTLMVTDLGDAPIVPQYNRGDVSVDLDPMAIPNLDDSAIPNFDYDPMDGVNGFTPIFVVRDDSFAPSTVYTYVGWLVTLGDTVTFKYDVAVVNPAGTPQLKGNAVPLVPEPGTALLIGLGLAGLSVAGRRYS